MPTAAVIRVLNDLSEDEAMLIMMENAAGLLT